jgi:hypothetical protein
LSNPHVSRAGLTVECGVYRLEIQRTPPHLLYEGVASARGEGTGEGGIDQVVERITGNGWSNGGLDAVVGHGVVGVS